MTYITEKEETSPMTNERLMIFGGLSHNGYIYNAIEEYPITVDGDLAAPEKLAKKPCYQTVFRPLIAPITFISNNCVYFIGGEFGKSLVQRCFQ